MQKPLSNNLNALGELVERYGYELITRYLSEIVLNSHVDPQSEDAKIWRDLNAKMTAAVDAYPKEHWTPRSGRRGSTREAGNED
jgi:hypothetical protein